MIVEASTVGTGTVVSRVVIKQIDPFDELAQLWFVPCVAAIGIGTRRSGRHGETAVGYRLAVWRHPVGTILDVVDLADRHLITVNHIATDMRQRGLLPEEEATAWDAVVERKGLYGQTTVVVDDLMLVGIHGMKHDIELQAITEQVHLFLQQSLESGWCIDL